MTLAGLWRAGRDGLARRLVAGNSPAMDKKSHVANRPSPFDHRPQRVVQRVPRAGLVRARVKAARAG
jgi:hypothetical protein